MENVSVDDARGWRQRAYECLPSDGWEILDPTRRIHDFKPEQMKSIFELDLRDINESDVILVNLNDPKLAKHGTAIEVFYANYIRRIPVVAFKAERGGMHPFFESLVTEWRSTVEKACDTLNTKYL